MVRTLAQAAANCARNITAGIDPIITDRRTNISPLIIGEDRVATLIDALKMGDCSQRVKAICGLADMGVDAQAAVPALMEAMEDRDWVVRVAAITALGELGSAAGLAVPGLIEALEKDDICVSAAIALGRIGKEAASAIEPLRRLKKRKQGFDCWCADEALRAIKE